MKSVKNLVLLILLYFISAITYFLIKEIVPFVSPILFTGIRFVGAAVLVLPFIFPKIIHLFKRFKENPADFRRFIRFTTFRFFINFTTVAIAMKFLLPITASLIANLNPFITAFLGYLILNHRMTKWKMVGITLGFVGFLFTLAGSFSHSHFMDYDKLLGSLFMIISVAAGSYGWFDLKYFLGKKYNLFALNTSAISIAGPVCLVLSLLFESKPLITKFDTKIAVSLLLLIVLMNIIYINLYGYLLKKFTPTLVSLAVFLVPVFVILINHFYLENPLNGNFFVSLALITVGMLIFYREETKQGYI